MASLIGKTVSHYKILEKLGEGGMGVVYKAEDTRLKRTVALKFLPRGLESHETERARFLQEAQAASALNHPNVCTIYDIGGEGDQQFIAMEFVQGVTLREKIAEGKLQTGTAVSYAIQIGEALEEAHSKGIVHRDIKAENIMVNSKNQIKVMDFGLAKLKGSLKLTKATSTVGTLAYMAPEQIQGGEVDARSDIFSFGVLLYEMLSGHFPFRGEHEAAMVYSIVNEEPDPVQKYRPDLPSELLHIVNRALEKDPEDRYQSAHEMVIDLRRLKKESTRVVRLAPAAGQQLSPGPEIPAPPEGPARAWKKPLWIGAAGLLLLAAAALLLVLPSRIPKLNPNFTQRTLEIPLTGVNYPSLSRDGKWVAFPAPQPSGSWAVYFMNVAKRDPKPLTNEPFALVGYADISPDASEVLYATRLPGKYMNIYVVGSQGGNPRKIVDTGDVCRWRPDGQRFGYIRGQTGPGGEKARSASRKLEFWTARPDGGDQRLEFVDSSSSVDVPVCFDWSPDAASVAWLHAYDSGHNEIVIHDLTSGKERQLTSQKSTIDELAWCTNGQILYSSSKSGNTNLWMVPSEGGPPVQVTRGSGPDLGVRVSSDGKRMLYLVRQSIAHVWTADIDGGNMRQLTFDNCNLGGPLFSPDGSQISFSMSSADAILQGGSQIFIMQSDGTNRRQITSGEAWYFNQMWSPDGKRMTYGSVGIPEPADSARIYLIELSNPGTPKCLGRGWWGPWVDTGTVVLFGQRHSSLYSVKEQRIIQVAEDSTWQFPLQQGKYLLIYDSREGKRGTWLTGGGTTTAPRRILAAESATSVSLTPNFRSLIYVKPTGEICRMSIPEGKEQPLPAVFKDLHATSVQRSYDDRKVTFLTEQSEGKLVLVENLFE